MARIRTTEAAHVIDPLALYRPRESASGDLDGIPFVVVPAQLYRGDHPYVQNFPHLFRAADPTGEPAPTPPPPPAPAA
jgi:hypothetical protein